MGRKTKFPATLSHWFGKFLKKNNLPEITFHELRHTSATLLVNLGIAIATVAKRLGHAQNSTSTKLLHACNIVSRYGCCRKVGGEVGEIK